MKFLIVISISFFSVVSCSTSTEPAQPKYTWEKIELKDEGAVYCFFGTIDDYLLIGTNGSILKSDDLGKNWKQVYNAPYTVRQFEQKDDTLFALAGYEDYFTLDNGESWAKAPSTKTYDHTDSVISSNGIIYKLEPQSEGELAKPTLVLKSEDGENWTEIFPFDHYIYSIYIDNKDRLYLGINGWEWDAENGSFDANSGNKAIIYYTR